MRVIVADTSPLNYLVLIDAIDVLPGLYGHIHVPVEVVAELSAADAPAEVAEWVRGRPDWLEIQVLHSDDPSLTELDAGERSAILLALLADKALLVMDDSAGRREATVRGIETIGTLGVLRLAAIGGLVDLPRALARLLTTNFRVSMTLVEGLLAEDRERRSGSAS